MRQAFIDTLTNLAEQDKDIYLLTADMGFGLVEPFATKFPKRFINVGVSEQNMVGVATGLALEGKKVFCYSIANFPTMRCLEQIRNDICYHNLPVCIVSGGAGLWYGALGMTHHAVEDIAVMRVLPNMSVVSPCDALETGKMVKDIYQRGGPCYMRMSRASNKALVWPANKHNQTQNNVLILVTGGRLIANAIEASALLDSRGIQTQVVNVPTIKPMDNLAFAIVAHNADAVITIEEHSRIGGLGSAVAEVLAGMMQHPPLIRMGTADRYLTTAMSYEELLVANHLTVVDIVREAIDALN